MLNNEMMLVGKLKKTPAYTHRLTVGSSVPYYGYMRDTFGIIDPDYYELSDSSIVKLDDFYEDKQYIWTSILIINPVADQEGVEDDYQLYVIFNKDGNNYGRLLKMSNDHSYREQLQVLLDLEEGKTYDVYISQTPPPFDWIEI